MSKVNRALAVAGIVALMCCGIAPANMVERKTQELDNEEHRPKRAVVSPLTIAAAAAALVGGAVYFYQKRKDGK